MYNNECLFLLFEVNRVPLISLILFKLKIPLIEEGLRLYNTTPRPIDAKEQ